jgi:KEOPS complex subunit Pcc1
LTSSEHDAELTFSYPTPERAATVAAAVARETAALADDRSTAAVARDDDTLTVAVSAADLVALRAATNTWTGLVGAAERAADAAAG